MENDRSPRTPPAPPHSFATDVEFQAYTSQLYEQWRNRVDATEDFDEWKVAEIKRLTQATVDQYNAGRASALAELDIATRANADAHRMVDVQCTENARLKQELATVKAELGNDPRTPPALSNATPPRPWKVESTRNGQAWILVGADDEKIALANCTPNARQNMEFIAYVVNSADSSFREPAAPPVAEGPLCGWCSQPILRRKYSFRPYDEYWAHESTGRAACSNDDTKLAHPSDTSAGPRPDSLADFIQRTAKELAHRTNLLDFAFGEMRQIAEEELRANTRTVDSLDSDELRSGEPTASGKANRPDTPLDRQSSSVAEGPAATPRLCPKCGDLHYDGIHCFLCGHDFVFEGAVITAESALNKSAALLDPQHAPVDDESRCAVCGWKLAESTPAGTLTRGCVRGNCSLRPRPEKLYAPERAARETEAVWGGPQHGDPK
jgi:hypothetical protein